MDRYLPRSRDDATGLAFAQHPAVLAAGFDVDVASTSIRVAESSLMPTITLQGSASRSKQSDSTLGTFGTDQASVTGQLTQPIYDGGTAASQTRQAKEVCRAKPAGAGPGPQPGPHRRDRRLGRQ